MELEVYLRNELVGFAMEIGGGGFTKMRPLWDCSRVQGST